MAIEETIDALQNQFHAAVTDALADNAPQINAAKTIITDALTQIKALLDANPNEAGERVVNPNVEE